MDLTDMQRLISQFQNCFDRVRNCPDPWRRRLWFLRIRQRKTVQSFAESVQTGKLILELRVRKCSV